jgi:hypothetical protein
MAQAYWGFATAVGVGAGAIAGALGSGISLSRGLTGAFLVGGGALLIAQIPLERIFYPNGTYVVAGSPIEIASEIGLSIALPALVLAPFMLRMFLASSWRAALVGTVLVFAAVPIAVAFPLIAASILRPTGT